MEFPWKVTSFDSEKPFDSMLKSYFETVKIAAYRISRFTCNILIRLSKHRFGRKKHLEASWKGIHFKQNNLAKILL